ncbi:hypothetical protein AXG93_3954s1140 [Marchantia polymorpha subsp. ruderalis]|uniref:Uncharacterized protein n=1 Tax=Marchantia polymorpha subsp. ruderalis TaxID=1480154 RepID=A0A176VKG8_MARPO|nr:hypothetical protein AXG93_3954s1140 [Marchantia polymorpha subsp. ruderalis]
MTTTCLRRTTSTITLAHKFTFAPFFKDARLGTNGWKTADYKDPKRRAIALGIMHILRPQRTTHVTAWQVTEIRLSKTRAKPKKKANRGRVVSDISDSSLAKTNAAASTTDEEQRKEPTLRVEEGGSLAIQDEVSMEVALEPLEKRTATANLSLAPLE